MRLLYIYFFLYNNMRTILFVDSYINIYIIIFTLLLILVLILLDRYYYSITLRSYKCSIRNM